jgi:hypothetical protein
MEALKFIILAVLSKMKFRLMATLRKQSGTENSGSISVMPHIWIEFMNLELKIAQLLL